MAGSVITYEVGWDASAGHPFAIMAVGGFDNVDGTPQPDTAGAAQPGVSSTSVPYGQPLGAVGQPPQDNATSDNLHIGRLPSDMDEACIKQIFSAYGMVVSVKTLPGNSALIRMGDLAMAQWLVNNLNGNIPQGLSTPVDVKYAQKSTLAQPMGGMLSGTVKAWMQDRGMGFIAPADGSQDLFVHRSDLCDGGLLRVGDTISFEPNWDTAKNKPVAKKVMGAHPLPDGHSTSRPGAAPTGAPPVFSGELQSGIVASWIEEKGFGFVTPDAKGQDIFVHRSCLHDVQVLTKGSAVNFIAAWDERKGKAIAKVCYAVGGAAAAPAYQSLQSLQASAGMPNLQPSASLVIRGLPADCFEDKLSSIFSPYGAIISCTLLPDDARGRVAQLTFSNINQAVWICTNLNGNMPLGLSAPVYVEYAYDTAAIGGYGQAPPPPPLAVGSGERASPYMVQG